MSEQSSCRHSESCRAHVDTDAFLSLPGRQLRSPIKAFPLRAIEDEAALHAKRACCRRTDRETPPGNVRQQSAMGLTGFGGPVSAFLVVRAGAVVPRALRRRLAVTGFSSILAVLDLAGGCGDCGGDCCGGSPERGLSSAVKSPEPIAEFVYYISARGRYGSTPRPAGARLRRNDPSTLLAGVLKAVAASEIIFAAVVVARSSDHCLGSLRASCPARRAFNS